MADNIQVAIRVRKLIEKEKEAGLKSNWTVDGNSVYCNDEFICGKKPTVYTFDHIFDDTTVTQDVFNEICKPILQASLNGFNGTIFAYGQSSSGKTHTITGSQSFPGIIPLAVEEIFNQIGEIPHKEFLIRVSYLELYNEKLSDLLADQEGALKLQEDTEKNIKIVGLSEQVISEKSKISSLLRQGNAKRHTAETKQNDRSSRSHCILRFVIESRMIGEDEDKAVMLSHLYFVDLAGSEKAGDNSGDRFREGCSINKSLFTLGNVIRKLSGDENAQHSSVRDSKLTRLLQNALGGNSNTAIICTITPAHIDETESTLKFASRAKTIQNKAHVNEVLDDAALLLRYRKKIKCLERQIKEGGDDELAKQLVEKEETIKKLRNMILISGSEHTEEPAQKKRRRETWAPGKLKAEKPRLMPLAQANFNLVPVKMDDPIIEEEEEPAEMALTDNSIDDVPQTSAQESTNDDTIHFQNEDLKQLYQLQDEHEELKEELSKKLKEYESLKEFKELDLLTKDQTIKELNDKIHDIEKGMRWLEDEYMKAKQESNSLKHKLESMNRQLKSVEDGTSLSKKCEQLSDAEKKIEELNAEIDMQKARYEFHIDQMKNKMENLTNMLEKEGVDNDIIKQRLSSQTATNDEITELRITHDARVFELQEEINNLVLSVETEQNKLRELDDRYNLAFEDQRNRFQKDIQDRDEEIEVYRGLLEEETAKNDADSQSLRKELEEIKIEHEKTIRKFQSELEQYKTFSGERQTIELSKETKPVDLQTDLLRSEIDRIKSAYEEELGEWKHKYEKSLVENTLDSNGVSNLQTEMMAAELDRVKIMYENKIKNLKEMNENLTEKLEKNNSISESPAEHDQCAVNELREYYENQIKELKLCLEAKEQITQLHENNEIESDKGETICEVLDSFENNSSVITNYESEIVKYRERINELEEEINQLKSGCNAGTTDTNIEEIQIEIDKMKLDYESKLFEMQKYEKMYSELVKKCEQSTGNEGKSLQDELLEVGTGMVEGCLGGQHNMMVSFDEDPDLSIPERKPDRVLKRVQFREDTTEIIDEARALCADCNEKEETCKLYEKTMNEAQEHLTLVRETVGELKGEVERLHLRNEKLKQENLKLVNEKTDLEKELNQKIEKESREKVIPEENEQYEMKIEKKDHEIQDLKDQLEKFAESQVNMEEYEKRVNELQSEKDELQEKLNLLEDKQQTLEMYEKQIESLKQIIDEEKTHKTELQTKCYELEDELKVEKESKSDNNEIQENIDKHVCNNSFNTNLIEEYEKEISESHQKIDKLEVKNTLNAELIEEYEKEISKVKEKLALVENFNNGELMSLKAEKESIERTLRETSLKYQSEIDELKRQIIEESKESEQLKGVAYENINELEKEKCELEKVLQGYKELETQLNENREKDRKDFENEKQELNNMIGVYKLQNEELKEEMLKYERKNDQEQTETLNQNKTEISEKDEEITSLKSTLEMYEKQIESLKQIINEEKTQKTALQTKCDELEDELKVEKETKSDNNEIQENIDKHVCNNSFNTNLIEEYEKEISESHQKIDKLEVKNTLNAELIDEYEKEISKVKEKLALVENFNSGELQSLKAEKESIERTMRETSLKYQSEIDELKRQIIEESKESEQLKDVAYENINELEKEKCELEKVIQGYKGLETQLNENREKDRKDFENEKQELNNMIGLYKLQNEELKEEMLKYERKNEQEQTETLNQNKTDLSEKDEEINSLKSTLEMYEKQIESLKQIINEEKTQKTELQTKCDELEDELKVEKESKSDNNEIQENIDKHVCNNSFNTNLIEEYEKEISESHQKIDKLEVKNTLNAELIDEYEKEISKVKEKLALVEKFNNGELQSLKAEKESIERTLRETSLKYQSEIDELKRQIIEESKESEQLKDVAYENINELEKEKCELEKVLQGYKELETQLNENREKDRKDFENEKQELNNMIGVYKLQNEELKKEMLKYERKNDQEQTETLNQNKTEVSEKDEEITSLKSKIQDLEDANMHLSLYLPPGNLKYHIEPQNIEWEKQWEELVKLEKRKRYVMASEIRSLRYKIKREEELQKADAEYALENIKLSDRILKMEKEIKVLEEEKEALALRAEEEKKSCNTDFISDEDHCCKYRKDLVHLKTEHFKMKQELDTKRKDIDEIHARHQSQVSKLKNEIRRRDDLETTFEGGKTTQPAEHKSEERSSKTSDMWCGSSTSGGIVDHFKACILEAENKRLKKELEGAKSSLALVRRKTDESDIKENLSPEFSKQVDINKQEVSKLTSSSGSSQSYALGEKASNTSIPETNSEQSLSAKKKDDYKFDISDLFKKPEEPDFKKRPVQRTRMLEDEDKNQCKTS